MGPDLITRWNTEQRLASTCFRGRTMNLAGNFSLWDCAFALFSDEFIFKAFMDEIKEATVLHSQSNSFCIEFGTPVGWAGTDKIADYRPKDLELFAPNQKSTGMRVRLDRNDLLAPRTSLITVIYELKTEFNRSTAIIHSIYPGRDIGEIRGNVSERESCVFFDWNHPGVLP